jgi:hypothetical protein
MGTKKIQDWYINLKFFITGGGEHGVANDAGAVSEVVAAHAVLGLEITDYRLDGRAPFQFVKYPHVANCNDI